MTTYANKKLIQIKTEINAHTEYGESNVFYKLCDKIIEKLGAKEWERFKKKQK